MCGYVLWEYLVKYRKWRPLTYTFKIICQFEGHLRPERACRHDILRTICAITAKFRLYALWEYLGWHQQWWKSTLNFQTYTLLFFKMKMFVCQDLCFKTDNKSTCLMKLLPWTGSYAFPRSTLVSTTCSRCIVLTMVVRYQTKVCTGRVGQMY